MLLNLRGILLDSDNLKWHIVNDYRKLTELTVDDKYQ